MAVFSNQAAVNDALTFGSALTGVGSAAYSVPSALIDNSPTGPRSVSYLNGLLRLTFSTPLTAGATGAPSIILFPLAAPDGTTLPSPPGTSAAAPRPNARQIVAALTISVAFGVVDFGDPLEGFPLGPFPYAFQLLNNAGVAWTGGGTITATLYRWNALGV